MRRVTCRDAASASDSGFSRCRRSPRELRRRGRPFGCAACELLCLRRMSPVRQASRTGLCCTAEQQMELATAVPSNGALWAAAGAPGRATAAQPAPRATRPPALHRTRNTSEGRRAANARARVRIKDGAAASFKLHGDAEDRRLQAACAGLIAGLQYSYAL